MRIVRFLNPCRYKHDSIDVRLFFRDTNSSASKFLSLSFFRYVAMGAIHFQVFKVKDNPATSLLF